MEKSLIINNLHSTLHLSDNKPQEIVVGIHGFSGDKESSVLIELAKHLNKNGVALITFDLPCHGENDNSEPLKLQDCLDSIKNIFDYVKENFKNIPISTFATSFGGYLLLNHLSKYKENLNKVILRAPAVYMADVVENIILPFNNLTTQDLEHSVNLGFEKQLIINKQFLNDLKVNDLEQQAKTKEYLYIIQGRKDDIVNPENNKLFFEKQYQNQHKFVWFENADHRFKKPGELERIILETLNILNLNK